jgi:hypothetical protein
MDLKKTDGSQAQNLQTMPHLVTGWQEHSEGHVLFTFILSLPLVAFLLWGF